MKFTIRPKIKRSENQLAKTRICIPDTTSEPNPILGENTTLEENTNIFTESILGIGNIVLDEYQRAQQGGLTNEERVADLKVASDFALAVASNSSNIAFGGADAPADDDGVDDGVDDGGDDGGDAAAVTAGIQAYERALRGKALDSNNAEIERTDKKQFFNEDFSINFNNDGQFYNNIWSEVKKLLLGIIKISK
jgi:hypothetical protein